MWLDLFVYNLRRLVQNLGLPFIGLVYMGKDLVLEQGLSDKNDPQPWNPQIKHETEDAVAGPCANIWIREWTHSKSLYNGDVALGPRIDVAMGGRLTAEMTFSVHE